MKVGILTFYKLINYGSFLQAYSLKKTLENMGHEVAILDYEVENPEYDGSTKLLRYWLSTLWNMRNSVGRKRIAVRKEMRRFNQRFENEWIPILTSGRFAENVTEDMDILIVGSDEVFNCHNHNSLSGFSPELFGENSSAKTNISYAASFGFTTYEKLEKDGLVERIGNLLKNFNTISVRDYNSKAIVEKLTGMTPQLNVDPVFVYDYSDEIPDRLISDKYLLVYDYSYEFNEEEAKIITEFAKEHNLKIVAPGCYYQPFADIWIKVSPFEMLSLAKYAEYIVAATFHGAVFTIKYQRPCAILIRKGRNEEKLGGLMKYWGMENQIAKSPCEIKEKLNNNVDYVSVKEQMETAILSTYTYLNKHLEE